jgi:predicted  nucleic acid-binding Zn-ribbon protein
MISMIVISLSVCMLLAGCEGNRQELNQARADATAAEARCQELQTDLAAAKEQLAAAQKQLAAAQEQLGGAQAASEAQLATLQKTVASLTTERDDAAKSAEQSATNLLSMMVQMQQQDAEYKAQIEALNKKIADLTRKLGTP